MRLNSINSIKNSADLAGQRPADPLVLESDERPLILKKKESLKRILLRKMAPPFLKINQAGIRKRFASTCAPFTGLFTVGGRFAQDASLSWLFDKVPIKTCNVLVVGCGRGGGEDVQSWLRHGVNRLAGVDIFDFEDWDIITQQLSQAFATEVTFQQGAADKKLPYKNQQFDVVSSRAVLEHIKTLPVALSEMARILKPGGLAWHGIGPLYFTFSGDHCISTYGFDHGYDHLLQTQEAYEEMVNDMSFFARHAEDPFCNYWARKNAFSFLKADEYLKFFEMFFSVEHTVFTISQSALDFKKKWPARWECMLTAGISERDLLIESIYVLLRKA